MGPTQRLNALRYKFEDMLVADKSFFGPARAFAKFLVDTIRDVSKKAIMDRVYDLVEEFDSKQDHIGVSFLTTLDVIGFLNPYFQEAVRKLTDFAYKGPTNLLRL